MKHTDNCGYLSGTNECGHTNGCNPSAAESRYEAAQFHMHLPINIYLFIYKTLLFQQ